MIDIQDQLAKVATSYGRMRHWITEIVAFEPTLNRAMRSLQPLVELGNLRHMSANDLRQVIRTMNERRESQWSAAPTLEEQTADDANAVPAEEGEATAASQPLLESAQAN